MINWINRYSDTMEDDKFGRWARIAFISEGINSLEIAWIRKCKLLSEKEYKFHIEFNFPRKGEYIFKTLKEAKKQVKEDLEQFIILCQNKQK